MLRRESPHFSGADGSSDPVLSACETAAARGGTFSCGRRTMAPLSQPPAAATAEEAHVVRAAVLQAALDLLLANGVDGL
jgi:hypothetical protein